MYVYIYICVCLPAWLPGCLAAWLPACLHACMYYSNVMQCNVMLCMYLNDFGKSRFPKLKMMIIRMILHVNLAELQLVDALVSHPAQLVCAAVDRYHHLGAPKRFIGSSCSPWFNDRHVQTHSNRLSFTALFLIGRIAQLFIALGAKLHQLRVNFKTPTTLW
jgi:hypothetical protein